MLERAPDAARGNDIGRERGDLLTRQRRLRRRRGRTIPVIALISDVLPAPLGPIRPRISPASIRNGHAAHRGDAAEADRDVVDLKKAHGSLVLPLGRRPSSDASETDDPFGASISVPSKITP